MDAFPAYFPLHGRAIAIVGDGEAALAKARLFGGSPARILRLDGQAALNAEAYAGAILAFITGEDLAFLTAAASAARQAGCVVNVVDRPELCDFTTPAVIDRGEVVAAIGTGGASPMLATLLRHDIETRVPEGAGRVAALFRLTQDQVRAALPDLPRRRAFLRAALNGPAAQAAMAGDMALAVRRLEAALTDDALIAGPAGRVLYLASDVPAELLSLKAARALAQADVLVIGPGCDEAVLGLARRDAQRVEAPVCADAALTGLAREGLQVVRLAPSPPDPAELEGLAAAGVATEILPVARP